MKYYRFKNGFFLCSQKGCFHLAKVRVDVVDNETETKVKKRFNLCDSCAMDLLKDIKWEAKFE